MFINAREFHKNKIKAIYQEIFDDPEEFVEYYFAERMIPERVLISEDESGGIKSMLSRNAKHLSIGKNVFRADYIYAVAVGEEHRGKGISKAMVNRALELSEAEEIWFSYLIPVSPRIYEGNGFVSVRETKNISLEELGHINECESAGCFLEVWDGTNIKELVDYCRQNYEKYEEAVITTYRDEAYFKIMLRQYQVENSQIVILRRNIAEKGNQIIGFAVINGEEEVVVCDYVCDDGFENILAGTIKKHFNIEKLIFKCNPIMVKITSPMFFTFLEAEEDGQVSIKIKETGRIYSITAYDGSISVLEKEGRYDIQLSLEELTRFAFNMIEIPGMIKIKYLVGITVNEEV